MSPREQFENLLSRPGPVLALAPMQDVTDLPFWRLLARYDGPDLYFTEYFRVHATSRLDKSIVQAIRENSTGRPIVAQMIGNDVAALVRTARELQRHPVAAIDLNLGCPAPVVCRKSAGGGLLREPGRIDVILGALREAIALPFTVKTRVGFESAGEWEGLLAVFARHDLDLLTVHGRTVRQGYGGAVRHDCVAGAVAALRCPVLANGDINSAPEAREVLERTGANGVMIGRGAVRNPWVFRQIRQQQAGHEPEMPRGSEVLLYVKALYAAVGVAGAREAAHVERMKKYMNFLGAGLGTAEAFLRRIRRVTTAAAFFGVCEEFLDNDEPMALVPAAGAA